MTGTLTYMLEYSSSAFFIHSRKGMQGQVSSTNVRCGLINGQSKPTQLLGDGYSAVDVFCSVLQPSLMKQKLHTFVIRHSSNLNGASKSL